MHLFIFPDGIKAQMAHAKAVNRKKNWDEDDPEGAASGLNTPITGIIKLTYVFYSFIYKQQPRYSNITILIFQLKGSRVVLTTTRMTRIMKMSQSRRLLKRKRSSSLQHPLVPQECQVKS